MRACKCLHEQIQKSGELCVTSRMQRLFLVTDKQKTRQQNVTMQSNKSPCVLLWALQSCKKPRWHFSTPSLIGWVVSASYYGQHGDLHSVSFSPTSFWTKSAPTHPSIHGYPPGSTARLFLLMILFQTWLRTEINQRKAILLLPLKKFDSWVEFLGLEWVRLLEFIMTARCLED